MSIVITGNMIFSSPGDGEADDARLNAPVIGWQNLATAVTAPASGTQYPASNMLNPSTAEFWRSTSLVEQVVEFNLPDILAVNYVGIARHNFGSANTSFKVQGRTGGGTPWEDFTSDMYIASDDPMIIRFPGRAVSQVRLVLYASDVFPSIAVVYIGELLVLQRNIYVGHTPINYGRRTRVTNGRSESGQFLGRIVVGSSKETGISLRNMTPSWYRNKLEPFIQDAVERPFFFAWRPDSYPLEVGYAWLTDDAVPVNQLPNGMMQVDMSLGGIAGVGK